ncbi:MAG: hypothetical protein M1831_006678 [Alyxoria varia]|nr:MAG: hypothetical protein M1831_006678 [Alyxoria varia]
MDSDKLITLFDDLSAKLTHLESTIKPLTAHDLPTLSSKLPLLDAAKLNVLSFTAIESLIFSALKVEGSVDAKAHPVHEELVRGKRYNGKIRAVEEGKGGVDPGKDVQSAEGPRLRLDKGAAQRFVKGVIGDVARTKGKDKRDASNEQTSSSAGKKRRREDRKTHKSEKHRAEDAGAEEQDDGQSERADGRDVLSVEHEDVRAKNDGQDTKPSHTTNASLSQPSTHKRVKHSPHAEQSSPSQAPDEPTGSKSQSTQDTVSRRYRERHPHKHKEPPKKKRWSNAPRSNHAVFQDLLERGGKGNGGGSEG